LIKWKVSKNWVNWLWKFRSTDKTQFWSSDFWSNDPLSYSIMWSKSNMMLLLTKWFLKSEWDSPKMNSKYFIELANLVKSTCTEIITIQFQVLMLNRRRWSWSGLFRIYFWSIEEWVPILQSPISINLPHTITRVKILI